MSKPFDGEVARSILVKIKHELGFSSRLSLKELKATSSLVNR